MRLIEAIKQIKYPEDKYIYDNTDDERIFGFNEGWNELREQLYKLLKQEDSNETDLPSRDLE
jgi:uncharacterized protein YfeS